MSQENVELVSRFVDAFNQRDLDALLSLMDDDVLAVSRVVHEEGGFYGHDGIRRLWEAVLKVSPDMTGQIVGVRDKDDLTLATVLVHGSGEDSETVWHVARWRMGKCVWSASFDSQPETLGSSGQDAHADS